MGEGLYRRKAVEAISTRTASRGILRPVADLEKHAFKRDRRFIVRLVLLLAIALLAGVFLWAKMTSTSFGTCAAGAFGSTSGSAAEPASQ